LEVEVGYSLTKTATEAESLLSKCQISFRSMLFMNVWRRFLVVLIADIEMVSIDIYVKTNFPTNRYTNFNLLLLGRLIIGELKPTPTAGFLDEIYRDLRPRSR